MSNINSPQPEGKILQSLRKDAGYKSAKAFAKHIGMPSSTYTHYEQSEENIPMRAAKIIARFLGCSLDELAGCSPQTARPRNTEIQDKYDKLNRVDQRTVRQFLDFLEERNREALLKQAHAQYSRQCNICEQYLRDFIDYFDIEGFEYSHENYELFKDRFREFINDDLSSQRDNALYELERLIDGRASQKELLSISFEYVDYVKRAVNVYSDDEREEIIQEFEWERKDADDKELEELMSTFETLCDSIEV